MPDRAGKLANVVLGRADFAGWEQGGPFNAIIGRYADRIAGGGFTLDGTFYKLAGTNPTTNVASHGGPNGFSDRLWCVQTFKQPHADGAILRHTSQDGENGFPGMLAVTVTYTLTDTNVLRLDYQATTSKPTVLNLTNHAYWNLGGADSGVVNDAILQVFASRWTPTDSRQVPTGEIRSVEGTPFDLRKPTRIDVPLHSTDPQMLLARGLDHNFVLDKPAGEKMPIALALYDPKSGRRMEVRTTEPGVQIYTGNYFNGSTIGANGRTLRQGDGIPFQTEHFPDSPNQPHFPSTVLRPGETFRSTTEFAFSSAPAPR